MLFWLLVGIIMGVWLDQTFTIPPLQDVYDKMQQTGINYYVHKTKEDSDRKGEPPIVEGDDTRTTRHRKSIRTGQSDFLL